MYVIDYVSNIVHEWVALLLRYVVMGRTWMGYETGFWNMPHRQWVTCIVPLVKCVYHACHVWAVHLVVLVYNGSWLWHDMAHPS